jgi:hypothetical protein
MGSDPIVVDLKKCMRWLLAKVDRKEMEHPLLQPLINDMPVLADATTPIDVFDKMTWSNHDFSSAERFKTCSQPTWREPCSDCKICWQNWY